MNEFKNIDKYTYKWISADDPGESRFFRNLLCRLVDAYQAYPKDLQILSGIEDYFRDFISYEPDDNYELALGNEFHTIRQFYDYDSYNSIRFPKLLLEDDWENKLNEYLKNKKHNDLVKQIKKLEEFLKTGPAELERLRKELADMDNV